MSVGDPLDLIVLVPGKDERETVDGLLSSRGESLGISTAIRFEVLVHPRRDPGCFHEAPEVLQPFLRRADYSLVLFDFEGCGQESRSAAEVTEDLMRRLAAGGWEDRTDVIVIDPELEVWLWTDSPRVETELGWEDRSVSLREWLREEGWWPGGVRKPLRPKETLEWVLRKNRLQRSSAIYGRLARRVGLRRCEEESFQKLCQRLRIWFPNDPEP